jgi:hypothetical protein
MEALCWPAQRLGRRNGPLGIELYIQGYRNGAEDGGRLRNILAAFGKNESDLADGRYRLSYDSMNSCEFSMTLEDGFVKDICIYRPCSHEKLYESIFSILRNGPYVLFTPGGNAPLIARPEMAGHLPDGMTEALGESILVTDARAIQAALFD